MSAGLTEPLALVGSGLGLLGVVLAAIAVVRTGPALLVTLARTSAGAGLMLSGIGAVGQFVTNAGAFDPRARGAGLLPAAGLLFTTFAATRVAQRRIDERARMAARRAREAGAARQ